MKIALLSLGCLLTGVFFGRYGWNFYPVTSDQVPAHSIVISEQLKTLWKDAEPSCYLSEFSNSEAVLLLSFSGRRKVILPEGLGLCILDYPARGFTQPVQIPRNLISENVSAISVKFSFRGHNNVNWQVNPPVLSWDGPLTELPPQE